MFYGIILAKNAENDVKNTLSLVFSWMIRLFDLTLHHNNKETIFCLRYLYQQ